MDRKKIITICLLLTAYFLYEVASRLTGSVLGWSGVVLPRNDWFSVPQAVGLVLAAGVFLGTWRNRKAMGFFEEVALELSKVVYPTPKESSQSAMVVVIIVGVATLLLALFDTVWSLVTQSVLRG